MLTRPQVNLLTDEQLTELRGFVAAATEERRAKPSLDDIRVGMSPDTAGAVTKEIERALRGRS